eukprot:gene19396-biopygen14383
MKVNSAYVEWLEDIQMDIEAPKEVIKGATHIEYHGPVTYIKVSDEASATFGTIEQGTTRTYDTVGTVLENVSGNSEVTTGSATFASSSLQDVNGDKEAVVHKPQSANGAPKNTEDKTCGKATENSEPRNNSYEDFSELRDIYRKDCSNHEVNSVQYGIITPVKLKIKDFAVILRIREEKSSPAADDTYRGEMARHMESLKDHRQTIEVEELLNMLKDDDKDRIVFVGGVAGIGKSVLAKRIAYDWSCNEKYEHVKCLLSITCRELNEFLEKNDTEIEIEEIDKYLKEKFKDVPIKDDKATLFLIDGLDELQKPGMIRGFTEKFSESKFLIFGRPHSEHVVCETKENFVRFSLTEKTSSYDAEEEISYQLITRLGDEIIRHEDESNIVRRALNKLPNDEVQLKVRFLADCFIASDKVSDVKFLKELLKSIKPSSNVRLYLNTFDQTNLLSILKLATENKVANSEIKNAFSGIEFDIPDLREMEILDYALWIDIGLVRLNDVNHFTEHQSMLVHRNVAFCGRVVFLNCKVPLFTTNANESTTKMKLKKLAMTRMKIDESEVSSAANLFCLVEEVQLGEIRVGGNEFEKIVEKVIQINPRRLKLMELWYCPLVNHDLKQKMKENGVTIIERDPMPSILILCEPESRDFVLELKENLDDKEYYIAMDENIEEFKRRYNELPYILVVFIQHQVPEEIERDILFAQNKRIKILLVKLEANFHPSKASSSVFDSNPCLDFTDKRNKAEMAIELSRMVSAIIVDNEFIVISNAPGNQSWTDPNIIAVKLDNNFQPGDELNKIVRESTCICWTDETNFDTNFAKVKEEINAEFVISKYVNWKKAGKLIAGTSSECLEKLSELSSFSQLENVLNDWKDYPKILDSMSLLEREKYN